MDSAAAFLRRAPLKSDFTNQAPALSFLARCRETCGQQPGCASLLHWHRYVQARWMLRARTRTHLAPYGPLNLADDILEVELFYALACQANTCCQYLRPMRTCCSIGEVAFK